MAHPIIEKCKGCAHITNRFRNGKEEKVCATGNSPKSMWSLVKCKYRYIPKSSSRKPD